MKWISDLIAIVHYCFITYSKRHIIPSGDGMATKKTKEGATWNKKNKKKKIKQKSWHNEVHGPGVVFGWKKVCVQ